MKIDGLLKLFDHRCFYCQRRVVTGPAGFVSNLGLLATRDHNIPICRRKFQPLYTSNDVLACHRCNGAKSDMTGSEFRSFLETGKIPASYVTWLETKLAQRMGRVGLATRGPILTGPITTKQSGDAGPVVS